MAIRSNLRRPRRSKARVLLPSSVYIAHDEGTRREMDVVASVSEEVEDRPYRLSFVVECKWSRDKPWVAFSGSGPHIDEPTAYTVASALGEAVAWGDRLPNLPTRSHRALSPVLVTERSFPLSQTRLRQSVLIWNDL